MNDFYYGTYWRDRDLYRDTYGFQRRFMAGYPTPKPKVKQTVFLDVTGEPTMEQISEVFDAARKSGAPETVRPTFKKTDAITTRVVVSW